MSRLLSAALACAFMALPSAAQSTDYVNGYYQRGLESGVVPLTPSEMTSCALHWAVWTESVSTDWDAGFLVALNPDLRPQESELAAGFWASLAQDIYEADYGDTVLYEEQVAIATEVAVQAYKDLMTNPDARARYSLFYTLGTCHLTFE